MDPLLQFLIKGVVRMVLALVHLRLKEKGEASVLSHKLWGGGGVLNRVQVS